MRKKEVIPQSAYFSTVDSFIEGFERLYPDYVGSIVRDDFELIDGHLYLLGVDLG